tara:strand:- start:2999 stop:3997 length:999 start_codon:yes stop_codon:yes gene_type:complete
MSEHKVEIVPVTLTKHPNADALSIINIQGYTVCARTEDWQGVYHAAYIEPDYEVPLDNPLFSFLQKPGKTKAFERIRVKKLRGVISQGLLVPAPKGTKIGDNVMEQLGVRRWDPPAPKVTQGEDGSAPPGIWTAKYDVESYRRYPRVIPEGELVVIREKIHGANARFVWHSEEDKLYVGSRTRWKEGDETQGDTIWHRAVKQNPWIKSVCFANPGVVMYGEVFGQVQSLKYGALNGQIFFAAFDFLKGNQFIGAFEWMDLKQQHLIVPAPLLFNGPMPSKDVLEEMADGHSTWKGADNIREGIVIRAMRERTDIRAGRAQFKLVGNQYLMKS